MINKISLGIHTKICAIVAAGLLSMATAMPAQATFIDKSFDGAVTFAAVGNPFGLAVDDAISGFTSYYDDLVDPNAPFQLLEFYSLEFYLGSAVTVEADYWIDSLEFQAGDLTGMSVMGLPFEADWDYFVFFMEGSTFDIFYEDDYFNSFDFGWELMPVLSGSYLQLPDAQHEYIPEPSSIALLGLGLLTLLRRARKITA